MEYWGQTWILIQVARRDISTSSVSLWSSKVSEKVGGLNRIALTFGFIAGCRAWIFRIVRRHWKIWCRVQRGSWNRAAKPPRGHSFTGVTRAPGKFPCDYSCASHVADRCNCPMLQTITPYSERPPPLWGHHPHLAMLPPLSTGQFVYISTGVLRHARVQFRVGANTTVTSLLLTRSGRLCRLITTPPPPPTSPHCFIDRTISNDERVRLAWDKTRCHAFAICHRTSLICISHLHSVA